MVISTDCPYCSNNLDIMQSQPPKGPIAIECPSCGKIFEYIHGFGSFDLPGAGKGVKAATRSKAVRGKGNVEVNHPIRPKFVACFFILLAFTSGASSLFIMLIPSSNLYIAVIVLIVLVIAFLVFVFFVIRELLF